MVVKPNAKMTLWVYFSYCALFVGLFWVVTSAILCPFFTCWYKSKGVAMILTIPSSLMEWYGQMMLRPNPGWRQAKMLGSTYILYSVFFAWTWAYVFFLGGVLVICQKSAEGLTVKVLIVLDGMSRWAQKPFWPSWPSLWMGWDNSRN